MRCGKWLGLLVLCGVSISGYASSEVEIRRSLDEHEFQAVSPLFDLGQTQRFDTYIELYRDGQYLLEQQPEAIKLRIKQKRLAPLIYIILRIMKMQLSIMRLQLNMDMEIMKRLKN